jgi:hypothetical protein
MPRILIQRRNRLPRDDRRAAFALERDPLPV